MSIKAKKSLGQHFLRSTKALGQIVTAAGLIPTDLVLEIGPGEGALTEVLLATGARVVAVETDARCITLLTERFAPAIAAKKFLLIEGDIRNEDVQKTLFKKAHLGILPYKLVANIPYYITGFLFRLFLERLRQPSAVVVLVQKEVAQQIVARDGKEGILSLSVKTYGVPRYVATVKSEAFKPAPKVDSAIIAVTNISKVQLGNLTDEAYFSVVKAGFSAKRKMLLGNLARGLDIPKEKLESLFIELSIGIHTRGEDVPIEKWLLLATAIEKLK